ncbi:MAG: DUF3892 domain-containing protein [Acidobacteria bacterium]|nr:MAG: DUF3892 domain-containing protein [Acidobacteriota bacterium]
MALRVQIHCINKNPRNDPHKRITHIGGVNADKTRWKLTEDDAITGIKAGKWDFFVNVNARPVDVIIATSQYGNEYLKTTADGVEPNNLLSLPECP